MAFPPTTTFGQLFPFQTSFEAKLFSSPETMVTWLTQQQKTKIEMRTKAMGLCAKSRRAVDGGVCVKNCLKILNCVHARTQSARKCPETKRNGQLFVVESTLHKDWDEIGSNRAKKGHLVLKSTIFSKLAGCQWVNIII